LDPDHGSGSATLLLRNLFVWWLIPDRTYLPVPVPITNIQRRCDRSEAFHLKGLSHEMDLAFDDHVRLWLMDLDPDPAIFVMNLQDANKKLIFIKSQTVGIEVFLAIFG
jgi:hypothetical protein